MDTVVADAVGVGDAVCGDGFEESEILRHIRRKPNINTHYLKGDPS